MTTKKKSIIGILCTILAATATIGGTLAYMTDMSEVRANIFTFATEDEALDARLVEPTWDGVVDYEYDALGKITPVYEYYDHDANPATPSIPVYGYVSGDPTKRITAKSAIPAGATGITLRPRLVSATYPKYLSGINPRNNLPYGDEAAKDMIPGQIAQKNPIIYNTGTVCDEWVAAKLTFVYSTGTNKGKPLSVIDYLKVVDAVTIDYEATKWDKVLELQNGITQVLYYRDLLPKVAANAAPGVYDQTVPMFLTVKVKNTAINSQVKALEDIGGFTIYIEGFAAQREVAMNYNAFKAWGFGEDGFVGTADDNVKFDNSPSATHAVAIDAPGIFEKPPTAP
jgi:hypothetical protein